MLLLHLFTSEERHKKKLKHFFLCVRSLQSTRDGCVLCERQRRRQRASATEKGLCEHVSQSTPHFEAHKRCMTRRLQGRKTLANIVLYCSFQYLCAVWRWGEGGVLCGTYVMLFICVDRDEHTTLWNDRECIIDVRDFSAVAWGRDWREVDINAWDESARAEIAVHHLCKFSMLFDDEKIVLNNWWVFKVHRKHQKWHFEVSRFKVLILYLSIYI